MAISYNDLNSGVRHIVLSGRLDSHDVDDMIGQLSDLLSSAKADVLVDLAHTTLICSMGVPALILNAKHVQRRGARMALLAGDDTLVSTTLRSVGIDSLLSVYTSLSDPQMSLLR